MAVMFGLAGALSVAANQRRWQLVPQLVPILLGWLVGTGWQLLQPALWPLLVYVLLLSVALPWAALGWLVGQKRALAGWLMSLLGAAVLAFAVTGVRASVFASAALQPQLEGQNIIVRGVVAGLPQPFADGVRFRFAPESAHTEAGPVQLPRRLELAWYDSHFDGRRDAAAAANASLQAGQRWQFELRLKAVHGNVNPHGFDYELWQWQQGVQATGYVRTGAKDVAPTLLGQSRRHAVERWRQRVRARIVQHVTPASTAGILAALVMGDQRAMARSDWDVFRATGVAHLMSISGLHITMFAWLAAALLAVVWRCSKRLCLWLPAPNAALIGGVLLAFAYAWFSGWGVPAQRTVLMLAAVSALRLAGLRWPWPQVWLLVCALVVAFDPWALLQAGFWLSFVAVGILFATGIGPLPRSDNRLWRYVLSLLREQWVMTLALAPLVVLLFGQISLLAMLANLLAVPVVTLLITPLAMLGLLWPAVWSLAAWILLWLGAVLTWLASWSQAVFWLPQAPWWLALPALLGGLLLALRLPWSLRGSALPLLLPLLLWQTPAPPPGQFELLAADVGQGGAVLVRTHGHALLYDAGPRFGADSDAGSRLLVPLLRAQGVRLDVLLLSHKDSDHSGGAQAVLAQQPKAQLISSIEGENPWALQRAARLCAAGWRWRWDGVDFEFLHPAKQDYGQGQSTNAMSCVLRISNGQQAALLTGDITAQQEAQLLRRHQGRPLSLRTDLLLVPHHGSKSSSSVEFLQALQPRLALVQAGYRNSFGHPAAAVVARYQAQGVQLVDSAHCGAAIWRSQQAGQLHCQRNSHRHYWQHQLP